MKKKAFLLAAAAATLAFTAPVSAGGSAGTMVGDPNPAEVGDTVTVSNASDGGSTCEPPILDEVVPVGLPAVVIPTSHVDYEIVAPDGTETEGTANPDTDGNWSVAFVADQEGTYLVNADCVSELAGSISVPGAVPDFAYSELAIAVQAQSTTTTAAPTTSTAAPTPTTAAAAAAAATPRYTG